MRLDSRTTAEPVTRRAAAFAWNEQPWHADEQHVIHHSPRGRRGLLRWRASATPRSRSHPSSRRRITDFRFGDVAVASDGKHSPNDRASSQPPNKSPPYDSSRRCRAVPTAVIAAQHRPAARRPGPPQRPPRRHIPAQVVQRSGTTAAPANLRNHPAQQKSPANRALSNRVSDGTRTHDRLDHNQELYQLSYAHRGGV
jgi:hypothetical protein